MFVSVLKISSFASFLLDSTCMLTKGEIVGGEEGIGRMGIIYAHYCTKQTISKNLLYSSGKSTQ